MGTVSWEAACNSFIDCVNAALTIRPPWEFPTAATGAFCDFVFDQQGACSDGALLKILHLTEGDFSALYRPQKKSRLLLRKKLPAFIVNFPMLRLVHFPRQRFDHFRIVGCHGVSPIDKVTIQPCSVAAK
jgi:hypothetical protein